MNRRGWLATLVLVVPLLVVLSAGLLFWLTPSGGGDPEPRSTSTFSAEQSDLLESGPSRDPDSIHVLVNRLNPLDPLDYAPQDLVAVPLRSTREEMMLREEASGALVELFEAAESEGRDLTVTSTYRSFEYQQHLFDTRVAEFGTAAAEEYTARPGHSEHQTGLAADVIAHDHPWCGLGSCFGDTEEGLWVAENAHRFGFVIRYQEGTEEITGFAPEPWHLRYVGVETAQEVHSEDIPLEEYWDEPPAPEYPEDGETSEDPGQS